MLKLCLLCGKCSLCVHRFLSCLLCRCFLRRLFLPDPEQISPELLQSLQLFCQPAAFPVKRLLPYAQHLFRLSQRLRFSEHLEFLIDRKIFTQLLAQPEQLFPKALLLFFQKGCRCLCG